MEKLYYGNYRGEIVDNSDTNGRCRVFVTGVYPSEFKNTPLNLPLAEPAMPLSFTNGRIPSGDEATELVPGKCAWPDVGAFVWVFFEGGDHLHPVYFANCPASNSWNSVAIGQTINNSKGLATTVDEIQLYPTTEKRIQVCYDILMELSNNENDIIPVQPGAAGTALQQLLLLYQTPVEGETAEEKAIREQKASDIEWLIGKMSEAGGTTGAESALNTLMTGPIDTITKRLATIQKFSGDSINAADDVIQSAEEFAGILASPPSPTDFAWKLANNMIEKYQEIVTQSSEQIVEALFPNSMSGDSPIKSDGASDTSLSKEKTTDLLNKLKAFKKEEILAAAMKPLEDIPLAKQLFKMQNQTAAGEVGFTDPQSASAAFTALMILSIFDPTIVAGISEAFKSLLTTISGSSIRIVYDKDRRPTLQIVWGGNIEFFMNGDITMFQAGNTVKLSSGDNAQFSKSNALIPFPISIATLAALAGANPEGALTGVAGAGGGITGPGSASSPEIVCKYNNGESNNGCISYDVTSGVLVSTPFGNANPICVQYNLIGTGEVTVWKNLGSTGQVTDQLPAGKVNKIVVWYG
jgi:hypothetical protein